MIIQYGASPVTYYGLGVLLLFDGDGEPTQTGPLVGQWSNIVFLQARQPATELQASPARTELQAKDS